MAHLNSTYVLEKGLIAFHEHNRKTQHFSQSQCMAQYLIKPRDQKIKALMKLVHKLTPFWPSLQLHRQHVLHQPNELRVNILNLREVYVLFLVPVCIVFPERVPAIYELVEDNPQGPHIHGVVILPLMVDLW